MIYPLIAVVKSEPSILSVILILIIALIGLISDEAFSQGNEPTKLIYLSNKSIQENIAQLSYPLESPNGSKMLSVISHKESSATDQVVIEKSQMGSNLTSDLKVITEFDLRCLNSNNTRCYTVDPFFESSIQLYILQSDNTLKLIANVPGSSTGWNFKLSMGDPKEILRYIVVPTEKVKYSLSFSIVKSEDCVGLLMPGENKTCNILFKDPINKILGNQFDHH